MLIDGRRIPRNETICADICIIGGGAAGITICIELAKAGFHSLLLEAGGYRHDKAVQALYDGESLSPAVHAPPVLLPAPGPMNKVARLNTSAEASFN